MKFLVAVTISRLTHGANAQGVLLRDLVNEKRQEGRRSRVQMRLEAISSKRIIVRVQLSNFGPIYLPRDRNFEFLSFLLIERLCRILQRSKNSVFHEMEALVSVNLRIVIGTIVVDRRQRRWWILFLCNGPSRSFSYIFIAVRSLNFRGNHVRCSISVRYSTHASRQLRAS